MGLPINPRYYVYYGIDVMSGHMYYEVRDKVWGKDRKDRLVSTHDNAEEAHNLANLANSAHEDEVRGGSKGNWHFLFFNKEGIKCLN